MKIRFSDNTSESIKAIPSYIWLACFGSTFYSGIYLAIDFMQNLRITYDAWLPTIFVFSLIPTIAPYVYVGALELPDRIKDWKKEHYKNGVLTL